MAPEKVRQTPKDMFVILWKVPESGATIVSANAFDTADKAAAFAASMLNNEDFAILGWSVRRLVPVGLESEGAQPALKRTEERQ